MPQKIRIHEIFPSIQGEGSDTGRPYAFIRTAGCNLDCRYCDTVKAKGSGKRMSLDAVIRKVRGFGGLKRVLITGGEPLVQKPAVIALSSRLLKKGYSVSLETNGSVSLSGIPRKVRVIMDLKTPSSGETSGNFFPNLKLLRRTDELKFVISDREDYEWACACIRKYGISSPSVLFSPAWKKLSGRVLAGWIMKDRLDVRLQVQLHKILRLK